ncbi:MAG: hypothetical protein SNJ29_07920 [Rikenellaceae bacterium]
MKDNKNTEIPIEQDKFVFPIVSYKGNKYLLPQLQFKIFRILSNGQRHTSHQLMQHCKTSDPRKNVQNLRDKGFNVRDV